jgi:hypothetical protein
LWDEVAIALSGSTLLEQGRRALTEYLGWARRRGEGVTDAEVHAVLGPEAVPPMTRGMLRQRRDLADCRLVAEPVEEVPGRVVPDAIAGDGTRMRASVVLRDDGNAYVMIVKALPQGLVLREAAAADGPRLAEVCRSTPIVTGSLRVTIDYGQDYLRATEVAEPRIVLLVEANQRIQALHGCVIHNGVVGDRQQKLAYLRHTRIDPTLQGVGVFSALNGALFERGFAAGATPYSLVAIGNEAMLEKLPEELRRWPWRHKRFYLDTRSVARRSAALAEIDADDAAPLIDRLYRGTAISPPTTAAGLRHRLAATPHLYAPNRLLGDARAVIGVSRAPIQVRSEGPDGADLRREVVAYDLGATDADGFEAVLRSWCDRLAAEAVDDLCIDVTTASPLHDRLARLARSVREYALNLSLPPPPHATGFRVDPMYI